MNLDKYKKIKFSCSICNKEIDWVMAGGGENFKRKEFRLIYNQNAKLICRECSDEEILGIDKVIYNKLYRIESALKDLLKYKNIDEYKDYINYLINEINNKTSEICRVKDIYGWKKAEKVIEEKRNKKKEFERWLRERDNI